MPTAMTTMVYSIAPCFSRVSTIAATVESFWPMARRCSHVLALLVQDGIHGDGCLAGLPVADDKLSLAPADRDHRVDGLDSRRQRLLDRLPFDNARRLTLDGAPLAHDDRALAVERISQGAHHAPDHRVAHGHVDDAACALNQVAFLDPLVRSEDHASDVVFLQVQEHAHDPVGELHQLA